MKVKESGSKIISEWGLLKSNNYAFYASFFRLFICFFLIKDVILNWNFNAVLFKGESFLSVPNSRFSSLLGVSPSFFTDNFNFLYAVYISLIILFFFGIGKRVTLLILYIFYVIISNLITLTSDYGDSFMQIILFYMIFIDSFNYFSINKTKKSDALNNIVSNLAGLSICIHVCLIYFISVLFKINTESWFNGTATYYALSLERFTGTNFNSVLANNGFFVTLSTYGTVFLELFYPVLVWFKSTKYVVIVMAVLLHLSIGILMMLYDFQLLFILVQGFFIPNTKWILIHKYLSLIHI